MTTARVRERIACSRTPDIFDGGGEMGELMRSIDWSQTPVGPVESWPQSLKTALSILLKQRTAVFIFWGPEYVQFYNDAYRPILGSKKHPAAMGQRGAECWPEIWDIVRPMLEDVHRGQSTGVEDGLLVIDRDGYLEEGYYTYTYSPIAEEAGAVGGVFCVVYDTTARVIGERRLRTLRDLGRRAITKDADEACRSAFAILSQNPHDIPFAALYLYESDRKSARLVCAAGIEEGSAATPREVAFDPGNPSVLAKAASVSRVVEIPDLAQHAGPLPGGPWPLGAESGVVLPLAIPGQALPIGFVLAGVNPRKRLDASYRTFFELLAGQIATAIAEARAHEEERRRAEALAELNRAKTTFFSNVSHEFRTPLTLMLAPLTDILAKPDASPQECRGELMLAHRNCLRLLKLVNTMLDVSRIEAGRIQARFEPTDLSTLTSDLASLFRSTMERAGLRLIVDCPPLGEPVFVDRDMWEKIVLNLLSNAFKFTLEGEIEVLLRAAGGQAQLTVRDTGVGIPQSQIARVFERFHRVEGTRGRSHEGSGIGLALVQELTRIHGGSITVESVHGKGSEFKVSIPLGSAHLPQEKLGAGERQHTTALGAQPFLEEAMRWLPDVSPPSAVDVPASREDLAAAAPGGRPKIVLADDNADMRDYLRRLLSEAYEVTAVADGAAALDVIRRDTPDLVLADVMMPGLDGFKLLQALRGDPAFATLPVILLSARAGEESRIEGLRAGADDYIVKPFGARELLVRVSSRLEIARLRRNATEAEFEHLRSLIHRAPAAIALLSGPEHVFRLVNDEYTRVTGRPESKLIGKPIREALPEIAAQGFIELLDGVYRTGEPFVGTEMPVGLDRRGDGNLEEHYFNFVYKAWNDENGRPQGVLVHAVDISEQVFARRRLAVSIEERRRSEGAAQLLGTIVDSSDDAIIGKDLEGIITTWNAGAERLFGYTTPEVVGKSVTILIPEDRLAEESDILSRLKRGERVDHLETVRKRKDGSLLDVSLTISPVRDSSGKIVGASKIARNISERRSAERAKVLLASIVDSSDDAIISKDLNGTITSWNQGAEHLFGYTAKEVLGKPITMLIPDERQDEESEILTRIRSGQRVDHFETVRKRKDGSLFHASLTISPVKDTSGNVVGASKIARDMTERRRAEHAIEALNGQLTSDLSAMSRMQQLSTRLVQTGDFSHLLGEIVEAGMEITQADMGNIQLIEDGLLKIVAQRGFDDAFVAFFSEMREGVGACGVALERRQRVIVEDVARSPIFAHTPLLGVMLASGVRAVQSTPLMSRTGQMLGVFSTHYRNRRRPDEHELRLLDVVSRQAADLIERIRAESELRQSELRFRELAEVAPQFIWVWTPGGSVDYVNHRWADYSGMDLAATRDVERLADAAHPEERGVMLERWRQSVATGEPMELEARLRREDGSYRWFVVRSVAVRDDHGRIEKWVGAATDIQEQKRVESELRRANEDLEQFAYSATHDLQEPLRSVKIYSELLADRHGARLDGAALEYLGFLRGGATRMETLIRDLLAYTQVSKLETSTETMSADEALVDTLANLKQAIADSGARVTSDPLPVVRIHGAHLKQLLQNLIGNAIKYRSPERTPQVHVTAGLQEGNWVFSVRDNGIGIEPEYKERIFGLFKRLHTGEEYSGTGIGLAICQRIVDRYHGRIWVESEPGEGSTFLFTLPT